MGNQATTTVGSQPRMWTLGVSVDHTGRQIVTNSLEKLISIRHDQQNPPNPPKHAKTRSVPVHPLRAPDASENDPALQSLHTVATAAHRTQLLISPAGSTRKPALQRPAPRSHGSLVVGWPAHRHHQRKPLRIRGCKHTVQRLTRRVMTGAVQGLSLSRALNNLQQAPPRTCMRVVPSSALRAIRRSCRPHHRCSDASTRAQAGPERVRARPSSVHART